MRSEDEALHDYAESDIAIVGMALRVPGARTVEAFWGNLRDGVESIRDLSTDELDAAGETPDRYSQPHYVRRTADLQDMEHFDADFFGLSPKDAAIMDPQHRHFLECAWEAMEDAARPPHAATGPIGVYAGCGMGSYFYFNVCSNKKLVDQVGMFLLRHTGNDKDFLATRASFLFNLQGPSVNVQTACSTSLVAVHYACQSLLSRECDMALAGGVTIELPHRRGYLHQDGEILSPDGRCRAFDHRAAGTVFGSGVGVVALRRLADALADGDPIRAVIKATAINNDGAQKAGYLAPSVDGQAKAVVEAHALAGLSAEAIHYVECHGTGTNLGDPIEIEALTQAFRQSTKEVGFCRVGSVKTNIGHLDTAAGVVSLIKTALALEQGEVPASLGFEKPNPAIDFAASPFVVNDTLSPWPVVAGPRRAGVNSLGVGGTNAHAILQQAPPLAELSPRAARLPRPELVLLSAKSRKALDAAGLALSETLERRPDLDLADVAYTLFAGRKPFEHRRVLAVRDRDEAMSLLASPASKRVSTHAAVEDASAVFLFPGGGAQHPGMAQRLYEEDAASRVTIDEGLSYLERSLSDEIRSLWLGARSGAADSAERFLMPSRQLPAILIVEIALARLWMSRGVKPRALIGHSMGENAAACVAGILSFRDAVDLVRLRGELFDKVKGGGMLSVGLDAAALRARLPAGLDLASVNAPDLCVVSGPADALTRFQEQLAADGVDASRVAIDIAAHSRMLEPILGRFEAHLRGVTLRSPTIPIVSNLTGTWLSEAEARDPLYWVAHLRSTVRFSDGLALLAADPARVYVEVGPGKTLSSLTKIQGPINANAVINSLPHSDEAADDHVHALSALGRGWATGLPVEVGGLWEPGSQRRVSLPTYPFQRQRFFLDRVEAAPDDRATDGVPTKRANVAEWGYRPVWRQALADLRAGSEAVRRTWLVFLDQAGIGAEVVARLRAGGHAVGTVTPADRFARKTAGEYTLCAEDGRAGYDALLDALKADGRLPDRILHLWLVTADESFRPGSSFFHRSQERGFYSLLYLAQALGAEALPHPLHVTAVVNGMQRVGDKRVRHPGKATILGPALVIPKELPGVTVRTIDLDLPSPEPTAWGARMRRRLATSLDDGHGRGRSSRGAFDLLWDDLMAEPSSEIVAYHEDRRWLHGVEAFALDGADKGAARFRERGAYLVTGGVGDLAIVACEELARRFKARLALVARTRLPDRTFWASYLQIQGEADRVGRAIAAIQRLEALGAEVEYLCADVSNPEEIGGAVAEAKRRFGAINGVIHTAGTIRDDLIQLKSAMDIEAVLAPKIQGTVNLAELFKDEPLDLFVLYSSTSTDTAPSGQIDYVAANAYLNAFADSQADRDDRRTVAIHWGVWNQVGLAARAIRGDEAKRPREASRPRGPLFSAWVDDDAGVRWLEGRWGPGTHWLLDEHRLRSGEPIWPGTGYLEIAAEAKAECGLEGPFEVEDLSFLRPLHIPDGETRVVRVRLQPAKDGYRLEVKSATRADGRYVQHAQAIVRTLSLPRPAPLNVAALERSCPSMRVAMAGALRSAQEDHLRFGPRWRVLRSLSFGKGEVLARLHLDPAFRSDEEDGYRLHPGLLDIATGCAMELVAGYDPAAALWAPVSYGRARVHARLPSRVQSWVRLSRTDDEEGFASFDVAVIDEAGELVVEVERLTVKRLAPGTPLVGGSPEPDGERSEPAAAPRQPATPSPAAAKLAALVSQGIGPDEGVDALFRALGAGEPQVIVSSMDLHALQRRASADPDAGPTTGGFERPDLDSEYVEPRTEVERTIAGFWTDLLGVDRVGIHDDFFDVGGHSLIAVRLFRKIRQAFAVDLPISRLLEAPTIAQCAALIGTPAMGPAPDDAAAAAPEPERPKHLHLVPMDARNSSPGTPFFLCAGMFGNVLNLRHLALLLGADRPVYGLQAKGLYGESAPHETFEEMARDYCAEIRTVQPHGPYLLGGFSGGGLTAYAMARRLASEGDETAILVLLDTPLPARDPLSTADLVAMKMQDLQRQRGAFVKNWAVKRAKWELGRLRSRFAAPEPVSGEEFHNGAIEAAFYRALSRLEVTRYPSRVELLRPKLEVAYRLSRHRRLDSNRCLLLEDNGWSRYAPDLTVTEVPGNHDSMVLEPNVRVLAEKLRSALSSAERSSFVGLIAAE